jgi:hypothetical protein
LLFARKKAKITKKSENLTLCLLVFIKIVHKVVKIAGFNDGIEKEAIYIIIGTNLVQ